MAKINSRKLISWTVRLTLIFVLLITAIFSATTTSQAFAVPTFQITKVEPKTSITIVTANFPKNIDFTVRMGAYGTLGVGGIVVATLNSGAGGAFSATFNIPADLKEAKQIAVRLDSKEGFYSYNWFYNNTTATTSPTPAPGTPPATTIPGYKGYPTFTITSVETDKKVSIQTANLPPSQEFTVRMGAYGTQAKGGIEVAKFNSDKGGSVAATFDVPAALAGSQRIAIRIDSPAGFYAYNWFWNNSTNPAAPETPAATPPADGYKGYPTFSITGVTADSKVSISTVNLPKNQDFTVRMGAYGTYAKGGIEVTKFNSGEGGAQTFTFDIPAALKGSYRIAIRFDAASGLYAYNWFYNNTTTASATPPDASTPPAATPTTPTTPATPATPGYTGFPTFGVVSVVKDSKVTITTANLPKNEDFTVSMGLYGTYAVGGLSAGSFNSGEGGVQTLTFDIPADLKGQVKIAIRFDGTSGLYAYNWFWNN